MGEDRIEDMQQAGAPRLRLAKDIDLSKAKRNCKCKGTGIAGWQMIETPEGEQQVPIICRCVSRRGGVKKDMLDRMMEAVQKQLDEGVFAMQLSDDLIGLPPEVRERAVSKLEEQANDESKSQQVREALHEALRLVKEKEQSHGNPPN